MGPRTLEAARKAAGQAGSVYAALTAHGCPKGLAWDIAARTYLMRPAVAEQFVAETLAELAAAGNA